MKVLLPCVGAIVAASVLATRAANPGDEVVVVYNTHIPQSKEIAEYYALKRQVPTNQIFGFDLPTGEDMSRGEYQTLLQFPLAKAIKSNKLWEFQSDLIPATNHEPAKLLWKISQSRIRYIALCYGVPVRIAQDPTYQDDNTEKQGAEMRRNEAAVDNELALLPLINDKVPLNGPVRNPMYMTTNEAILDPTHGILLVTRLDGPTPEIARGLVDKALEGEKDGLWGRTYFDLRNITDPAYKLGDDWIRNAAEICKRLGFDAIVDEKPETFPASFPMSQIALYIGWYDANVSGPFTRPNVEFMPGAFAYHLHSYSAKPFRSSTQAWVGPLLAKGATITMGCVEEPYLSGTPDLTVFTARLFYNGMSFAQAAYSALPVLSWQITVVGDPLYRPFGKNPEALKDELLRRNSKLLQWYYLRLLNVNLAAGKPVAEAVAVLEQFESTKSSPVLTEKLGDLYIAQGKPSSAVHAYQEALKLDPSPMQRLRLLLTIGEKLASQDRDTEAYETFQTILKDYPDFPDKLSLYRSLLPLAKKLAKPEAATYEAALNPPTNAPSQTRISPSKSTGR